MANGETDRALDRLQDQVDATRAELGEVAGAVNSVRDLLGDLGRRSGSEHQAERWQARLGSLETRLEMIETAIRTEVERMRGTAGAVDALAEDFRATVGDTRSLVSLTNDIGERLAVLHTLEREVRDAANEVAAAVEQRLDHDAAGREERDRALVDRLAEAIAESQRAVADLGERVDGVARVTADLPSIEQRLSSQLREATAWGDALAQLHEQLDAVRARVDDASSSQGILNDAVLSVASEVSGVRAGIDASEEAIRAAASETLSRLTAEIAAVEERMTQAAASDTRLSDLSAAIAQVRGQQPQLAIRLDQIVQEIAAVQSAFAEPLEAVRSIGDRVDALSTTMRNVIAAQPDPRPQLEALTEVVEALRAGQPNADDIVGRLADALETLRAGQLKADEIVVPLSQAIDALRSTQTDPLPMLQQLAVELSSVRARLVDPTEPLQQLGAQIESLRSDLPDPTERLQQLETQIDSLRAQLPDPGEKLDQLAADLASLRAAQPDLGELIDRVRSDLADLRSPHPDTTERLDRLAADLAELRAAQAEIELGPVAESIADMNGQLGQLRAAQPATEALVSRVSSVVNDHTAVLSQLQAGQPQIVVRLDQLAADVAELTDAQARVPSVEQINALGDQIRAVVAAVPDAGPDLDRLTAVVAELRHAVDAGLEADRSAHTARFEELAELLGQLVTARPELDGRLDQLAALLADVRARTTDPAEAITPLVGQLEGLTAAVARVQDGHDRLPDSIASVVHRIDALQESQGDPDALRSAITERLDRLVAEIDALRTAQPSPDAIAEALAPVRSSLAELGATISALRDHVDAIPAPVIDVAGAIEPVHQQLAVVDQRASSTIDAVRQLETGMAQMDGHLQDVAIAIGALRDVPSTAEAIAPLFERIGVMADAIAAMRSDMTAVGDAINDVRAERADVAQFVEATTSRLDVVAANVAEVRDSRPDLTSSFVGVTTLIEALQESVTDTRNRLDGVTAAIDHLDPRDAVRGEVAPLHARLDAVAAQVERSQQHVDSVVSDLVDAVTHGDTERSSAMTAHIEDFRETVHGLGDRHAAALDAVVHRFEQMSADMAATQEAVRAIDEVLRAPRDDTSSQRLADLGQEVATLASEVKANVRAVVGLGTDVSSLRHEVGVVSAALPERAEADTALQAALARIDTALAGREVQLRQTIQRLDGAVTDRDNELRAAMAALEQSVTARETELAGALTHLDATVTDRDAATRGALAEIDAALARLRDAADVSRLAEDLTGLAARFDSSLADLRREVQSVTEATARTDVLDMVRTLTDRDPSPAVESMQHGLRDVRADVQSTRAELQTLARALAEVRDEVRRPPESDLAGGAAAALVASAASAMARLEARIDGEFGAIARQMEALGTLVGQAIDAVHRVEVQVVGVHPGADRIRNSAAAVLENLRATSRQRRPPAPPSELGSGW